MLSRRTALMAMASLVASSSLLSNSVPALPNYELAAFNTIVAPVGLAADVSSKFSTGLHAIARSSAGAGKWAEIGITPIGSTTKQANADLHQQAAKLTTLVKDAELSS